MRPMSELARLQKSQKDILQTQAITHSAKTRQPIISGWRYIISLCDLKDGSMIQCGRLWRAARMLSTDQKPAFLPSVGNLSSRRIPVPSAQEGPKRAQRGLKEGSLLPCSYIPTALVLTPIRRASSAWLQPFDIRSIAIRMPNIAFSPFVSFCVVIVAQEKCEI